MIATPMHVYVHMPKTGGMWVAHALHNLGNGHKIPGTRRHARYDDIPQDALEGRMVFGSIRDPWAWYASLWQHLRNGVDGPPVLRALGDGDESFGAFLRGMTDRQVWATLPEDDRGGWPWPPDLGGGFYTSLMRWYFGHPLKVDALIDQTQLRVGLEQILDVSIDEGRFPPKNSRLDRPATAVKNPHTLYNHDEVALVQDADGEAASELGFLEPFSSLPEPVLWP